MHRESVRKMLRCAGRGTLGAEQSRCSREARKVWVQSKSELGC